MSVMNLLMIESLSFVRALAAHVDQLRELMGEGWPDFIAKLEQVLGKICKADTDTRVLLLVDEIFDVGLEEPAGSLVRSLHKQAAEKAGTITIAGRSRQELFLHFARARDSDTEQLGPQDRIHGEGPPVSRADLVAAVRDLIQSAKEGGSDGIFIQGSGAIALEGSVEAVEGGVAVCGYVNGDVTISRDSKLGGKQKASRRKIKLDAKQEVVCRKIASHDMKKAFRGNFVRADRNFIALEFDRATPEPPPSTERRISVWISERAVGSLEPLWVKDTYTLNFKVGQLVQASLISGPETAVPSSDVPAGGLYTEWVVNSRTVRLGPVSADTSVTVTTMGRANVWTARFSLLIPEDGDSLSPQLQITPRVVRDAGLEILIYVGKELYRQFSVQLATQKKSTEQLTDSDPATIHNDILHTAMAHTGLRTTHEWTTPTGVTTIAVVGQFAHIFGDDGARNLDPQVVSWPGVQAQVVGPIKNVRAAAEKFRARWESYLNDIDPDDLAQRLARWSPEYDWTVLSNSADVAHQDSWEKVRVSSELRDLAYEGHVLHETFFPRNTPARLWLDSLTPGHRLNISWLPTSGVGWVPHIPWGLMYLPDIPAPGDPVDPLGFLALRFRLCYAAHQGQAASKALGPPEVSYRGHFLYWGDQPQDITGIEAQWQRQQWAVWQNQVFVPSSGPGPNSKLELLRCLDNPGPAPMTVLYFFCQCAVGDGNEPVLRFGSTAQTSDAIRHTDLGTRNFADQPFVFANACTTSAGDPYIANEFEEGFFRRGSRAFLGTESKVPIQFASRFASVFFHFFYRKLPWFAHENPPQPVAAGEAFSQTRLFLWTQYRNMGGLFYTYVNQYELFMASDSDVRALRR